jgi:DNA-binding MarR family transcriptional regulator
MECLLSVMAGGRRYAMTETHPVTRAGLQGRVTRELAVVQRLSQTRFNRALRPLGLSMTQVSVLARLTGPDGATVGELAQGMEINQPGISKIVAGLTTQGAVRVASVQDDARRRLVHLTPTGRRLLDQARTALHPEASVIFGELDDAQLETLHALLVQVRERLDALPG